MKFKNTKPIKAKKQRAPRKTKDSKLKKLQFPSIYRRIPEKQEIMHVFQILKKMAIFFIFAVMTLILLLTAIDLYVNYIQNQQIQDQRQKFKKSSNGSMNRDSFKFQTVRLSGEQEKAKRNFTKKLKHSMTMLLNIL